MEDTKMHITEVVKRFEEEEYRKMWGWTDSTGQFGSYPYIPIIPWEYDPLYSDEKGEVGSHGGCSTCAMTLVHLRAPLEKNIVLYLLIAIVILYLIWQALK